MNDQISEPLYKLSSIGDWEICYRKDSIKLQILFGVIAIASFTIGIYLMITTPKEEKPPSKPLYAATRSSS